MKYPFECPIYSINITLGVILNYCMRDIKHTKKCSNIMENKNKTYIFLLILFPPFLSGRYERQPVLFFLRDKRQTSKRSEALITYYMCTS